MATAPEAKIDTAKAEAAAEKAYAQAAAAAEAKVQAAPAAEVAPAPAAKVAAPVAAPKSIAKVAKPAPAQAAPVKKASKPAVAKTAVKPAAKIVAKKPAAKPTATIIAKPKLKDTIMTTTENMTTKLKDVVSGAQDRAKTAFEKTSAYASEYGAFTKGNLEAVVESGKILAAGMQDMGKTYVAEGKSAIETITADVKEITAVKSPSDFFKLQGELMRRNFDAAVASTSKHSEAMVKLAGDAFAPISTRVSLAVEKVKQAA